MLEMGAGPVKASYASAETNAKRVAAKTEKQFEKRMIGYVFDEELDGLRRV